MQMQFEEPKKLAHRRTVDLGETLSRMVVQNNHAAYSGPNSIRPEPSYIAELLPPISYKNNTSTSLCTKFVHTSVNKMRHTVLSVAWTPDGRRVLTGSMSGEFTLWNGLTFNFETIMQAHESGARCIKYSHNGDWILSGDQDGVLKYWQPNFNNVKMLNAHREVIRDVAFSPNDARFVTASDDGVLKIWNFNDAVEESTLTGHGWDVKTVDWHPTLGLLASGSKDNLVKLWDPRSGGKCLTTLHGYKNTVTKCRFQPTGGQRLLASTSRDHSAKVFDLRMMKDMLILKGHNSDVSALTWHPVHSDLLTTGTHDGKICHFLLDSKVVDPTTGLLPHVTIPHAHDWPVWALEYHPLGHLLCSGSNDRTTRFWCRPRPADDAGFTDRYYVEDTEGTNQSGHNHNNHNHNQQNYTRNQNQNRPFNSHSNNYRGGAEPAGLPGIPGLSRG